MTALLLGILPWGVQEQQESLAADRGRQLTVAIVFAVVIALWVVELVRRRKLREEYSVLWLLSAGALLVMAALPSTIVTMSRWIGSGSTPSTLFFFALVFLLLLCLQFSMRLSKLTNRSKLLVQQIALLQQELDQLGGTGHSGPSGTKAQPRESTPGEGGAGNPAPQDPGILEPRRAPSRVSER